MRRTSGWRDTTIDLYPNSNAGEGHRNKFDGFDERSVIYCSGCEINPMFHYRKPCSTSRPFVRVYVLACRLAVQNEVLWRDSDQKAYQVPRSLGQSSVNNCGGVGFLPPIVVNLSVSNSTLCNERIQVLLI